MKQDEASAAAQRDNRRANIAKRERRVSEHSRCDLRSLVKGKVIKMA